MSKESGRIVIHKVYGKEGRTYNSQKPIEGKIRVYWNTCSRCGGVGIHNSICSYRAFNGESDNAVLCSPEGLKVIGFVGIKQEINGG